MEPVAIIDGGGANIASLQFALRRLGRDSCLTSEPAQIRNASHVILPGVGAAQAAMERLQSKNLVELICGLDQPLLGICLGMQLLFEGSEEDDAQCLGLLPGCATRFTANSALRVPHMGWNQLQVQDSSPLLTGLAREPWCYFVHSYAVDPMTATTAVTDYGRPFSAVVERENVMGTQFHPERSGKAGAQILRNFLTISR